MRFSLVIFGFLAIAGCSGGREEAASAGSAPIVSIEAASPVVARRGAEERATVRIRIADGYHVQANPAANEFLIPLELRLDRADGVVPGTPAYPPGRSHSIEGAAEPLLTYEGELGLVVPIAVSRDAPPGAGTLAGLLKYQACDDRRCFFPATLPVEIGVTILD
jgi:hypothetical protein